MRSDPVDVPVAIRMPGQRAQDAANIGMAIGYNRPALPCSRDFGLPRCRLCPPPP